MKFLANKKIVIGVSGGIAAYKIPELVRRLRDLSVNIKVIMTEAAKHFVTALTLETLSGCPVFDNLFDNKNGAVMDHITLAKWADIVLIAPATANLLARLTIGAADDLLTCTCLATTAKIIVAPAMNQQMYNAVATQANLQLLQQRGVAILGPDKGEQACGDNGWGRMLDPAGIITQLNTILCEPKAQLSQHHIVITAGPTHEPLDPVRYLTNKSSAKMGFALAEAATYYAEKVTLIAGPCQQKTPKNVHRIDIITALEMHKAALHQASSCNIFIGCAAVADYRCNHIAASKIKKTDTKLNIELIKNPDIIADVAAQKNSQQFIVGFAAETEDLMMYAKEKLYSKKLDLICANNIALPDQGFNSEYNELHLLWPTGEKTLLRSSKTILAQQLIKEIMTLYDEKNRYQNH